MAIQARKEQTVEASEEKTRDKILSAAGEVFAELSKIAVKDTVSAQEPVHPVTPFGALAGALGAPTVDQTASKGDWAIQFAAPKSEAEARVVAARLNAKYAPALNGATIGVHKTQVNGETTYALRVVGLSKADATALCVRTKS